MLLLLSGEGPTDIGRKDTPADAPVGLEGWDVGPMASFINELCKDTACLGKDIFVSRPSGHRVYFIDETSLNKTAKQYRKDRPRYAGRGKGNHWHNAHAYTLASVAKRLSTEQGTPVVVVFFRDCDGSNAAPLSLYKAKRDSMKKGFARAEYDYGVAMIPRPKSEAWLLCALKAHSYQHCEGLENESGNDASPNSLKRQVTTRLNAIGREFCQEHLVDLIAEGVIDPRRITITSFNEFRQDFEDAIRRARAEQAETSTL